MTCLRALPAVLAAIMVAIMPACRSSTEAPKVTIVGDGCTTPATGTVTHVGAGATVDIPYTRVVQSDIVDGEARTLTLSCEHTVCTTSYVGGRTDAQLLDSCRADPRSFG